MKSKNVYAGIFWGLLIVFTYVFFVNAWIIDEGYVTFRTIDNFVNGYGLTWNVQERVQAYTHPMWLFVICLFYIFTSEFFFTSMVVSYLFCLVAFIITHNSFRKHDQAHPWKPALLMLILIASKAFIDYTSSGLENPLSYLLATLFYLRFLLSEKKAVEFSNKELFYFFFIASLAFFNRQDTVLLYAVPLVFLIMVHVRRLRLRLIPLIFLATLPATLWLLFSIIYYGFPFPNTAYAKLINAGIPLADSIQRGWGYFGNSLSWDITSHAALLPAVVLAVYKKSWRVILTTSGVILYYIYIITSAASATHMSGRFFSVPLLIASLTFVVMVNSRRVAVAASVILIAYIIWNPISSIRMGTTWYKIPCQDMSYLDAKYFVHEEGGGLVGNLSKDTVPDHVWYHEGLKFRNRPEKARSGGAEEGPAIGYFAYAAGPDKYIIDIVGLGDPLLARLPAYNTVLFLPSDWHSGHFYRAEPTGYIESVREGGNRLEEPMLRLYYDYLLKIITGPVFDRERFLHIYNMNVGKYEYLKSSYISDVYKMRRKELR